MFKINKLQSGSIIDGIFSGDKKTDEEGGQVKWQYLLIAIKKSISYSVL